MAGESKIGLVNIKSKQGKILNKFWTNDEHNHLNPISVCYSDKTKTFFGISCVSNDVELQMGTDVFLHKMTINEESQLEKKEVKNCKEIYEQCKKSIF